ncbi:hypothetical protein COLO4_27410 [Corchorus olitorius]|uniref:Uncharacterized protein n=1 Tax=Corchorus olitorius TaxID=93759 RepID=A0A1R3HR71_9ROSI|nr:hypothetical protein COLO4_27410 [Corchorus olitorius]
MPQPHLPYDHNLFPSTSTSPTPETTATPPPPTTTTTPPPPPAIIATPPPPTLPATCPKGSKTEFAFVYAACEPVAFPFLI